MATLKHVQRNAASWMTVTRWVGQWTSRNLNHFVVSRTRDEINTICGRTWTRWDDVVFDEATELRGERGHVHDDCRSCSRKLDRVATSYAYALAGVEVSR